MAERKTMQRAAPGSGDIWLVGTATVYGLYALYLVVETLDFLALLHSLETGFHATYDVTTPMFHLVEAMVCAFCAVAFFQIRLSAWRGVSLTVFCITVTGLRAGLVHYLYYFTVGDYHFVPFIYKKANNFSELLWTIVPPIQIVSGLCCAWACRRAIATVAAADE